VTRARDVVVLTRAQAYGAQSRGAQPSSLLALLEATPDAPEAAPDSQPLLTDGEIDHLLDIAVNLAQPTDDDRDDGDDTADVHGEAAPAFAAMTARPVFHLRELEQYLTCPLQYKYAHRYRLLDPAEDAVYRFHRYIRQGARELHELHTSAPGSDWPTAAARLKALWETAGPAGHAYDAFYWQRAEEILRAEWETLVAPGAAEPLTHVLLAQPLQATLRSCIVEVTADRVVSAPASPQTNQPATAPLTMLVRLHTGRPREADTKDDLTLPLYYLAHQQRQPGAPVSIALNYVGDALVADADASGAAAPARGELVDVTEIARNAAEKYSDPGRKRRSALDKLDEAAQSITAGQFPPRFGEARCAACAYCYICPADPDSAEASDALAQTQSSRPHVDARLE
jgi:hypothetical protein